MPRSAEDHRNYMRDYQRKKKAAIKAGTWQPKRKPVAGLDDARPVLKRRPVPRANPEPKPVVVVRPSFEPPAPKLMYEDYTAFMMGDPPIGRRAIDQRGR
jgi:hypothetical protein